MANYYNDQLKKIVLNPQYYPTVKIITESAETNWMAINPESAQSLVDWLTANFLNTPSHE